MDCPPSPGAPTFQAELKRGVNPYNLSVGAISSIGLGSLVGLSGLLPGSRWTAGILTSLALFLALTLLHTLAHATMGFLFERGLEAHCRGNFRQAKRWLAPAAWKGMEHYDPNGVALQALQECRRHR